MIHNTRLVVSLLIGDKMIRARFRTSPTDYRPVNWPVKHPYWCTGKSEHHSIIVAYATDEAEILTNWPDATQIESETCDAYTFTSRFPCPKWFVEESK